MSRERQRYLDRRAVVGPWQVEGETSADWQAAVVIPACDEDDWLFATLDSLAANPQAAREQCLVLVVVNQAVQAPTAVAAANRRTLERLRAAGGHAGLNLAWIDAAGPGLELTGGPGPARRLGLDRALAQLAAKGTAPLVCLDADTLVDVDYLPAILHHFADPPAGGAVLAYAHQPAPTPELQLAIDRYELFLRCHQLGLQLAGSPYAFPTIGSAMACSARAYVRIGGMNQRPAAEDFYFLQALAKTDGVAQLSGTCVHPSARISTRVVFGTGPAMQRLCDDPVAFPVSPLAAYRLLGAFLRLAEAAATLDDSDLCQAANALHPQLDVFLSTQRFEAAWQALRANHPQPGQRHRAFHGWFDALKSLQLLRYLAASEDYAPLPVEQAAAELLTACGTVAADNRCGMLRQLREMLH